MSIGALKNNRKLTAVAPYALLILLSALVYGRSFNNYFLSDSFHVIAAITHKGQALDWGYVLSTFYRGYEYAPWYYRPLTIVTYAVAYAMGGTTPYAIHFFAYAFHLLASIAVFVLGRRFLPRGAALFAALLFAVHPLHSEVVLFEPAIADSTMTAALLWALELYLRYRESRRVRHILLASLCYLVALASKEPAVIFAGLLVLADGLVGQPRRWLSWRYWLCVAPFVLSVPLYFYMRRLVLGSSLGTFADTRVPLGLALSHLKRIISFTLLPLANHQNASIKLTAAAFLLGVAVLAYRWLKRRDRISLWPGLCCLGALVLCLLPALPFWALTAPDGATAMETRFLYLATAFGVLFAGWAATVLLRHEWLVIASLTLMVAYFAFVTHRDTGRFEVAAALSRQIGDETERLIETSREKRVCLSFDPGPVRFEGANAFFTYGHIGFSLEPPFHHLGLASAGADRLCVVKQEDTSPSLPFAEYVATAEERWTFEDASAREAALARWQKCALESAGDAAALACPGGERVPLQTKSIYGFVERVAPLGDSGVTVTGWAADVSRRRPAIAVMAILNGSVIAVGRPARERPDVVSALGMPRALGSGFELPVSETSVAAAGTLRLFAVSSTLEIGELQRTSPAP